MRLEERNGEHGWMMKGGCVGRGLFVGKDEGVVEGSKERSAAGSRVDRVATMDISL